MTGPAYADSPLRVDGRGRTATTGADDHVRDMIRAVLFTNPGERVNVPDFGCGMRALVFAPNSDALAGTTELMVRGALQRWLEAEILVERVAVEARDETLVVVVAYTRRADGVRRADRFATSTGGPA